MWLQYPDINETLADAVIAWVTTAGWESSRAHLRDNAAVLLTDAAEAALEHLIDANPAASNLREHLDLLHSARAQGLDAAYDAYLEQAAAAQLASVLGEWLSTRTWAQSREFATAHADELLHPTTAAILGQLAGQRPGDHHLRVHRGLLGYAATAGFDAAYQYLADASQLRQALDQTDREVPDPARLALARMHSGLSADDPEAHYRLAVTTLLAGNPDEAAAAIAACADHAAPYERRDFFRRLAQLASQHPDLTQAITAMQQILTGQPTGQPDS